MNRSLRRTTLRAATVAAVAAATVLLTAAPAFAHVTAQPGMAAQGGYTVVTFRVPDESDTAGTVKLEVRLPADHPITSVRTTPIPGWTAAVTRATLDPPVQVDGNAVTEAVSTVTWTAASGTRIGPGEYLDFPLSLGPLPTGVDQLALPATQTYDDGQVVAWDQPSTDGAEPERPAPVVRLTPAAPDPMGGSDGRPRRRGRPAAGPAAAAAALPGGRHGPLAGRRRAAGRRARPGSRGGSGAPHAPLGDQLMRGLRRAVVGEVSTSGPTVSVPVAPFGPAGRYQVGYRVVSGDGHPVEGSTTFTLTKAGPGTPPAQPAAAAGAGEPSDGGSPVWPWIAAAAVAVAAATILALRLGRS